MIEINKISVKQANIVATLCVNKNDLNKYIEEKIIQIIKSIKINHTKSDKNNIIVKHIISKEYNELVDLYKKKYSSLIIFIQDIEELIDSKKIIISKKNKIEFQNIIKTVTNIELGLCNVEYIKFIMKNKIINYDSKNFINHINGIIELIETKNIDNINFYSLKRNANSFTIVFKILKNNNILKILQNSSYANLCNFNPNDDILKVFSENSISLKDNNQARQFIQFKVTERIEEDINDSITFKNFIADDNNKNLIGKLNLVIKKNKLSSFAVTLLLEHIFYVSETLQNDLNLDKEYFEKCLLALYNGDAKYINEKGVK